MFNLDYWKQYDEEVFGAVESELSRQRNNIELIASENLVSPAVMAACGSVLTNKYAEGYPGKRYYGGCEYVDIAEEVAKKRLCEIFGCEHANVQPHSGANANWAVQLAVLNPGDTIMGMNLTHGGHLTHGHPINVSGKYFKVVPYGVNEDTETIDYDEVMKIALECRPKLIICGASAYPRKIDFRAFREIADASGAFLMADIAHIAGPVAAGLHESPVPYADFVTSTTHKTLRGPRGGVIMCREKYAKDIDRAVFPGVQGGPLMHIIAGKAVAFGEALKPEFKEYQKRIIANAARLAARFTENGIRLVSGGTDNHLMLLDLTGTGVTGKELEKLLDEVHITANKNTIPKETLSPFVTSGLRLGTPAVTTRGMNEDDMVVIADLITEVIRKKDACKAEVSAKVAALLAKYPLYE